MDKNLYNKLCLNCRDKVVVSKEEVICAKCGGDLKTLGKKLQILTSNGNFRKHL